MKEKIVDFVKGLIPPSGLSIEPYEWMIKATPQHEWIDRQGIFLMLAFFFSEIGAGLYFMSMFFNYKAGLAIGWFITLVLGGFIHILYLGNPKRTWRMFLKPGSSELSRGLWIISIFALLGFIQIIAKGGFNPVFDVIMGILCILIIMHGFSTMNVIRALPAWSSTMVLPLSLISGVWVGSQILQFMLCISMPHAAAALEVWSELFLLVYIGVIALYLWGTFHSSETAQFSINRLLKGDISKRFYAGVLAAGMFIPLVLTLIMWGGNVNIFVVFLRLVFVFAGDIALRYAIMKSAVYTPLL